MAEDAEEQLDRSDFTCPFCLDILHEPVLLPCCSANFCRPCLQEMIDGGLGSCPTCRKPSKFHRPPSHTGLCIGQIL